ncbi:MAG: hypothetical protein ACO3N3_00905 [bacterium]
MCKLPSPLLLVLAVYQVFQQLIEHLAELCKETCSRVAVDQDHPNSFFLEGFAGLRATVVKLTGLTNHDRARANQQDGGDIVSSRHNSALATQL